MASDQKVCIYHIGEIFLYEYYFQPGDYYEISAADEVTPLVEKADAEEKKGGLMGAASALEKALQYNPVSTYLYFRLIDIYYRAGNLDLLHEYTQKVYPFCATRAELAQYYRWQGYWCLETYKPEMSQILYRYSTCFEKSEMAEHEIKYLESALGHPMKDYTVEELQDALKEEGYPVTADPVTLALLYRAGEEAAERENIRQALDCLQMVYDLTGDEEVKEKIDELNKEDEDGD